MQAKQEVKLTLNAADGRTWMFLDGTVQLIADDDTDFHGNQGPNEWVEQPLAFRPVQTPAGWSDIDGVSYSLILAGLHNWDHAVWAGWSVKMGIGNNTRRPTEPPSSGFIELMCTVGVSDNDGFMPWIAYHATAVGRIR